MQFDKPAGTNPIDRLKIVGQPILRIDGQLKSTDTQSPYNWSFNTTTVSDGSHTLLVKAFDGANNVGTATRVVVVQNGPTNPPPNPGGPTIPRHPTDWQRLPCRTA